MQTRPSSKRSNEGTDAALVRSMASPCSPAGIRFALHGFVWLLRRSTTLVALTFNLNRTTATLMMAPHGDRLCGVVMLVCNFLLPVG